MSRKVEQGLATKRLLLDVARRLFVDPGYAAVSNEMLVREAGVTRGALYHHFKDRTEVFDAVYREVLIELDDKVTGAAWKAAEETGSVWEAFMAGARCYLDLCLDPVVQHIVLLDAPVVLGWRRWEELDMEFTRAQLAGILEVMVASGDLVPQPVEPLAKLLTGLFNQAGRLIAQNPSPVEARAEYGSSLEAILAGLRPRLEPKASNPK